MSTYRNYPVFQGTGLDTLFLSRSYHMNISKPVKAETLELYKLLLPKTQARA
jgi:hypothetical protein